MKIKADTVDTNHSDWDEDPPYPCQLDYNDDLQEIDDIKKAPCSVNGEPDSKSNDVDCESSFVANAGVISVLGRRGHKQGNTVT